MSAIAAVAALVFASIPASVAFAGPAGTIGELQTQLAAGGTVQLTADINAPASTVSVPTTVTLDLNGFNLDTSTATIGAGATFTVVDTAGAGSWDAVATSAFNPGIGTLGATLLVDGATIRATGAADGAGIGGVGSGTVA
ncbi:MAG: hypothetical protein Q7J04_08415, partial [Microcella sp.]|nr:hypothetical protein [Microcella sp.]